MDEVKPLGHLFWRWVDKRGPDDCWEWRGARQRGYGVCDAKKYGTSRPHIVTYEWMWEPVSDGLQLDHLCKNRACCNPKHLEPVTAQENLHRSENYIGINARKTQCPQGHAYDGVNSLGRRICKQCQREAVRRSRAKRKS